jgi:membrane-associated phospholipid phosphatase
VRGVLRGRVLAARDTSHRSVQPHVMRTTTTSKNPIEKIAAESEHVAPEVKAAVAPSWVRAHRAWLFQVYVIIAAIAFGALAFFASSINYFPIDLTITQAVQSIKLYPFDVLMRYLTVIGFAPQVLLLWSLTILYLYLSGLKWESFMALFAVGGATLVGGAAKLVVGRPRPDALLVTVIDKLTDTSFPSGHVLFYVSFVGFLWFLSYTLLKPGWRRTLALWLFGAVVALAGLSRIYLGEHWPSDVLGAYLLGSIWLTITIAAYRWGKTRYFVTQPVAPSAPAPVAAQPGHAKA